MTEFAALFNHLGTAGTTIISVILVFGTLVFIHELGHFTAAKLCGVRVYDFALGFGPVLWKKSRHKTKYSVRAFPLGGFVRMAGMDEAPPDLAEPLQPQERFDNKPLWKRLAIIVAGPASNFLLAFVIITVYNMAISIPPTVQNVAPDSPAAVGGMLPGDEFVAIAGEKTDTADEVINLIQKHADEPVLMKMRREGALINLTITPKLDLEQQKTLVGIELISQNRQPFGQALRLAFVETGRVTAAIWSYTIAMITGQVKADISGPVGIVVITGTAAQEGLASMLRLMMLLNINLGLFNLFPVPMLDGFWMMILIFEAIRRRPLAPEQRGVAQFVGLAFLMLLLVFATYQDIARFLLGA